ncbi:Hypothetical_protein [Hexamita inflata]|uniref:Hypothetical_protein n=1 Tax=Hexamita inflata TaxID=28002 RepID=A0AA86NCM8_9EUKA|nr:Hypothetical protein HINF_LOCUS4897 [Hexamita inflata]
MSNNQAIQQFQKATQLNNPQVIKLYMQETNNQIELAVAIYNKNFEDFVDLTGASDEQARKYLNQHHEVADAVNALQNSGEEIVPRKKIFRYHQTDEQIQKHIAYFRDHFSTSEEIATSYVRNAYNDILYAFKKYQQDLDQIQRINGIGNKQERIQQLIRARDEQNIEQPPNVNDPKYRIPQKPKTQASGNSEGQSIVVQVKNANNVIDFIEQQIQVRRNEYVLEYKVQLLNNNVELLHLKIKAQYYDQVMDIITGLIQSQNMK